MTYAAYLRMDSEHAYVRHADGITYECPWQTRPRCLLGLQVAHVRGIRAGELSAPGPAGEYLPDSISESGVMRR